MNNLKTLQRDLFTSKFYSQPIFSQDFLPFSVITNDNTMVANLKMRAHTHTQSPFYLLLDKETAMSL